MGTGISVFESGSGRWHWWAGLGFLVLVILLLRLFSCRTLSLRDFLLYVFSFGIPPHAGLGDRDAALHFRENMATWVPWENNAAH